MQKTYITTMPDKAGAFLRASEIIAGEGGNIVRVNNKRGEIEVWTPGGENFHSYQYFGELKFK